MSIQALFGALVQRGIDLEEHEYWCENRWPLSVQAKRKVAVIHEAAEIQQ